MLERLGEHLDIPLRDRNQILISAGYAPAYPQSDMDDAAMTPVREALDQLLASHEPYPAVVVDRRWDLVTANASAMSLLGGLPQELLAPPVNTLRITLHPAGLSGSIVNLAEYREHLLARLRRTVMVTGDADLAALHREIESYPAPPAPAHHPSGPELFVPFKLRMGDQELTFFSTITTFGTALDVTMAELSVEAFFPADDRTRDYLHSSEATVRAGRFTRR